jgi:hypothetical protein
MHSESTMTLVLYFFFEAMSLVNEHGVILKRERGYDQP